MIFRVGGGGKYFYVYLPIIQNETSSPWKFELKPLVLRTLNLQRTVLKMSFNFLWPSCYEFSYKSISTTIKKSLKQITIITPL